MPEVKVEFMGHDVRFSGDTRNQMANMASIAAMQLWDITHPEEFDARLAKAQTALEALGIG